MSKADEMFERLGYECKQSSILFDRIYIKEDGKAITFNFDERTFCCLDYYDYYEQYNNITMQELKAINQFCEEKGWLDEK